MATLVITRGLPSAGKTTFALDRVRAEPMRWSRVNRDELGVQLHGQRYFVNPDDPDNSAHPKIVEATEKAITVAQHAAVARLLQAGRNVIVDDTNLRRRSARDLLKIATLNDADFEVEDFTHVSVEECIRRDVERGERGERAVGEAAIRRMADRYMSNLYELPLEPEDPAEMLRVGEPYVRPVGKPRAVMVDIDGTVALMAGRSPYDETRVHEDRPNEAVIAAVRAMADAGYELLFCSGRTGACRQPTEEWLKLHVQRPYAGLFMRAEGDTRKDSIVKIDLFDQNIRYDYDVLGVFDDRAQVVAAWRAIGLTVFAVAEGNF